ncbi:hypothetical protein BATDEDRAFT_31001 [Batrachochytrium dendrobatidis JAM81]|uniref:Glutamine-dependent NAD(+) synthetase n=1 Tax=Batrachochytrium dendrobatidis (strain JAM81 / FGSC 10211) TaxID=684364 RepID=F4PG14_BATDJ|nr:uncharacterized protein BATDEDRAFT_31001 [Batrachochytrium dendrobatidis JAM81]EGF75828.1 hypothetical protein BATDEDRAFT_31001 [Batrachochytrium dendrobatidis JAM81]|eukprot:XP_006683547.1 hypothetical protein BATDEDRAFT_31001 [Batrachochytrium dendrobatidis JAM81]
MPAYITLATCSLNQWALDFSGNYTRIQESIDQAKAAGACYRLGPELEIPGYGCNDHFLEADTHQHSWEVLAKLLENPQNVGITCDVGMPVMQRGILYNCRVIFRDHTIVMIRPKMFMADDGDYREIRCAVIGTEICEELFTPHSPHVQMSLDGVEIFTNGSASHHEFCKLEQRVQLIKSATEKCGGIYLYSNQKGCDGERVYYDGCPLIVLNGDVVAQGAQFSLAEVEVITATVDLDDVRAYRSGLVSRSLQAASIKEHFPVVHLDSLAQPCSVKYHSPSEEIRLGPACWLWDYLRRTQSGGYFLPLSGGIDSCSSALIVFSMCELVHARLDCSDKKVIQDLEAIVGASIDTSSMSPSKICGLLLHTCYMGTINSSNATRDRAAILAKQNIALQNIQARLRMVIAYLFAQLLPWTRDRRSSLLVLGSANVDEMLRGYLTKYDCSSADLNPLGGISKVDLVEFVKHMAESVPELDILSEFVSAPPTAELEPITLQHVQTDEDDMGMSYKDLSVFGTLRKISKMGPVSMFQRLLHDWGSMFSPTEIAAKVKRMFFFYSINRHKATIMPPAYHMSSYSADDNRFDMRPFLYNASWKWQFEKIDDKAKYAQE